jgi:hypothetical protein
MCQMRLEGKQELLQLRVLCLGLLQDGDVGVGVFPDGFATAAALTFVPTQQNVGRNAAGRVRSRSSN